MSILKKVKWNVILSSIIYVILGVLLIIWPDIMTKNICYVVGFFAIAIGIVNLIDYIRHDIVLEGYRYSLVVGLAFILVGVFILSKVEMVMSIIPFLLGLAVTISGFMKFQNAIDLIRLKYSGWGAVLFIASLNIAFGIVLMVNPFESALVLSICIGIGMIYSGVSDLIATIMLSNSVKKLVKEIEKKDESNVVN